MVITYAQIKEIVIQGEVLCVVWLAQWSHQWVRRLTTEALKGVALAFQGIRHVHSSDGLAIM